MAYQEPKKLIFHDLCITSEVKEVTHLGGVI